MNRLLIYFIFQWFLCKCTSDKSILIEFFISEGAYNINLDLGQVKNIYSIPLDMSIDFIWTSKNFYEPTKSEGLHSLTDSSTYIDNELMECFIIKDIITLFPTNSDTLDLRTFNFYLLYSNPKIKAQALGLGYSVNESRHSCLIPWLKQRSFIDKRQFSFVTKDQMGGFLIVGDIPDNEYQRYKYKQSCKVIEGHSTWGCSLSNIIVDYPNRKKENYDNNNYAYFNVKVEGIYIPKDFVYNLKVIFREQIEKDNCNFDDNQELYCKCDIVDVLPNFSFVFDGNIYQMKSSELMKQKILNKCILMIFQNKRNNRDKWTFGSIFMKKYLTTFSYDEKTITFNSENKFISFSLDNVRKTIIWFNIIILFSMVIYLIYSTFVYK